MKFPEKLAFFAEQNRRIRETSKTKTHRKAACLHTMRAGPVDPKIEEPGPGCGSCEGSVVSEMQGEDEVSRIVKTSGQHFEIFRKECLSWIDKLGLKDFRIDIEHRSVDWLDDAYAGSSVNAEARMATILLTLDWVDCEVTEAQLRKSALHEVCEIMLHPLKNLAETRFIRHEEVGEAVHVVIRRLENAFTGPRL